MRYQIILFRPKETQDYFNIHNPDVVFSRNFHNLGVYESKAKTREDLEAEVRDWVAEREPEYDDDIVVLAVGRGPGKGHKLKINPENGIGPKLVLRAINGVRGQLNGC